MDNINTKNKLAIILPVRKSSQRVSNKLLRQFGNSNLFNIFLDKLENFKDMTYVAAYEKEFIDICIQRKFKYIKRTKESANSESLNTIHTYLESIDEEWIFMLNACNPFIKIETINEVINILKKQPCNLFSVKLCPLMVWDANKKIINKDLTTFNSKLRKPLYIACDALYSFNKKRFLKLGCYWEFKEKDPELFIISEEESIDINTTHEFKIANMIWKELNRKN